VPVTAFPVRALPATALRHPAAPPSAAQQIAALMRGFSIGATAPAMAAIAELKPALPPRTKIHLTAVAGRPYSQTIEAAVRVRAQGLEPVPHLAARDIESHAALDDVLSRLTRWAGVQRMLIVGGDSRHAKGAFGSALELIESGLLQRAGLREIAVAAYPGGHPRLSQDALDRALIAKIEAGAQTGLGVSIVTQLCFDADAMLGWVRRLRHLGIENPVRIGMAGPADLSSLVRLARRCGVRATAQTLTRHAGLTKHLLAAGTPDRIIRPLAKAADQGALGRVAAHFFAAADAAATARWAQAAASGRVVPEAGGGFRVEAPERSIAARL
jgi:methylenetetrahydrofolate reductase (NADPH)